MGVRYLITIRDQDAALFESWFGGAVAIGPAGGANYVIVPGIDAVDDEELKDIDRRLSTGGPRYHAGGPR